MSSPAFFNRLHGVAAVALVGVLVLAASAVVARLGGPDPLGPPIRTLGFSALMFTVFAVQLRDPHLSAGRRHLIFVAIACGLFLTVDAMVQLLA